MTEHGNLYRKGNWWRARTDSGKDQRLVRDEALPDGLGEGSRVSYEWRGGQARNLRAEGADVVRLVSSQRFLNPYGFVPTPDRNRELNDTGFADADPDGHYRLVDDRWTGRIRVRMRTETPLLSLEPIGSEGRQANDTDHKVFGIAERDGEPYVAPTSVKGMLRSSYEAITNSRFGVFPAGTDDEAGHSARLAYRMTPRESLDLVPARVSEDGTEIVLLGGTTRPGDHNGDRDHQYAAWIPWYGREHLRGVPPELLEHGKKVKAGIRSLEHSRGRFKYWRVVEIVAEDDDITEQVDHVVTGWINRTEQNINNKHDERLFFAIDSSTELSITLTEEHRKAWFDVIASYQAAHSESDIFKRKGAIDEPWRFLKPKPGKTGWSRHLWDPKSRPNARKLSAGRLLYVKLNREGDAIVGLYPVMIARQVFDESPMALAKGADQQPATAWEQLSPADRVFGWVNPSGRTRGTRSPAAYAGHVRIGQVHLERSDEDPIEHFDPEVPLSILGIPKPTQGRFYVKNSNGEEGSLLGKGDWYKNQQRLKGRKFYHHHAGLLPEYWRFESRGDADPTQDNVGGRFREYIRPRGTVIPGSKESNLAPDGRSFETTGSAQQDSQNRSITGWIKPDQTFTFNIHLRNLTDMELGALLWLLSPHDSEDGAKFYHRLGYGKPLGFGSIELEADFGATQLTRGSSWTEYWGSLGSVSAPANDLTADAADQLLNSFAQELEQLWPGVLRAYLAFGRGDPSHAVHYPRLRPEGMPDDTPVPPDPQGRAYEWFVANERPERGKQTPTHGTPLPDGAASLPIRRGSSPPSRARQNQQQSRGGNQRRGGRNRGPRR